MNTGTKVFLVIAGLVLFFFIISALKKRDEKKKTEACDKVLPIEFNSLVEKELAIRFELGGITGTSTSTEISAFYNGIYDKHKSASIQEGIPQDMATVMNYGFEEEAIERVVKKGFCKQLYTGTQWPP